ncbi:MAG: S8 family serine peptidase [Micromonosporaceae bacterium]
MYPRRIRTPSTLLAAVALGLALSAAPVAAQPAGDPVRPHLIDPQLRARLATAGADDRLDYLVVLAERADLAPIRFDRDAVVAELKRVAARSQRPVVAHLQAQGAEILNSFWLANRLLVRSDPQTLHDLTALPAVAAIDPVATLRLPEAEPAEAGTVATVEDRTWGIDRIGAHRVWEELGVDGSGVRVAVLDTGVAVTHPDLAGRMATDDPTDPTFPGGWMEWDAAGRPVASQPRDTHTHGTHVSGTVVGGDASGVHIGVAPGARLMHGLVLPGGSGTTPQIIAGMQWALDPYDSNGDPAGAPASVVNMSFGPLTGGVNDQLVEPVRNLYLAGVLPVAAAGNCGDGCHGSPGDIVEALSVGATDVDDDVAEFSSGAEVGRREWSDPPAGWPDVWTVPDLSAPGVAVRSSIPASLGPPYGVSSGTSMAAPHVAGTAALMLSGDPQLSPDDLVAAMVDTSFFDERHGPQRPNTRFGHGRLDAFQAVSRVLLDTGISGRVTDAGTGEPVPAVTVSVPEAGVSVRTRDDGRFDLRLHPGSYTVELAWSGRSVSTVTGVVVGDGITDLPVALPGLAGVVADAATGAPVAGARVAAVEPAAGDDGVEVTTGKDGAYRLYLRPGSYDLRASGFGYEPVTRSGIEVVAGTVADVDLDLPPLPVGTVTGRVTYAASGLGVPGVTVALSGGQRSTVTGADGRYTLRDVPVGDHSVVVSPAVFDPPAPVTVTVTAGAATVVDAELTCGGECSGRWVAHYRGPAGGLDSPAAVAVSPDGARVFVTGSSSGVGTESDYATVAYDAATGQQLWEARYDGPAHSQDGANAVAVSPDGTRVVVTGLSLGRGVTGAGADYATVAYDAATGQQLWVARYNGPADDFDNARAVAVSPDGTRVVVTGQSRVDGARAHTDYVTVAYDAATGQQLWEARYDGPSSDFDSASDLVLSPDGTRVFVTGQSPGEGGQSSDAGSGWDYATVAYDTATGDQLWVARYDGEAGALDLASAVAVTPDGSLVVVTGRSAGNGTGADYATVGYDAATGQQVWEARYNGPGDSLDVPHAVTVGPDGQTVYVTGESQSGTTAATADLATVAYRVADGTEVWAARYDGPGGGADRAAAVVASPDGSRVAVVGASEGDGTRADVVTVSYDPATGTTQWVARYDGAASDADSASAAAFSPDGTALFVTGRSALGLGDDPLVAPSEFVTIAYDATDAARAPVFVAHDVRGRPDVVMPGEPVRVTASVTNVGTAGGHWAATLVVDGAVDRTTTVTLDPGERTTVEWPLDPAAPGRYEVRVGHASASILVVSCGTMLRGLRPGGLVVPVGVACLGEDARVLGPVTVAPGAGLVAHGATLVGPVVAHGAAMVDLRGVRLVGPLSLTGGSGHLHVSGSELTGPVTVSGNTTDTPPLLSGNRVVGPLSCDANRPPPTDGDDPNLVTGPVRGQCGDL